MTHIPVRNVHTAPGVSGTQIGERYSEMFLVMTRSGWNQDPTTPVGADSYIFSYGRQGTGTDGDEHHRAQKGDHLLQDV